MRVLLASLALLCAAGFSAAEAFTLRGTVRAVEGGAPVSGAKLWLAQESGVLQAESQRDGGYTFQLEQTGAYQLVVMGENRAVGGSTGFIAGDAVIDIALEKPETVTVEVIGPTSQPLAGARLTWLNVNGQFNLPVAQLNDAGFPAYRSGGDGRLTLPPLPVGGFVRLRLAHFDHADLMVDYLPVREKQPALQMVAGQRLGGRVVSPEKQGIEGARLSVFQMGVSGQREFATATTDREGFFHCRVPMGDYSIGVRHHEWASPPPAAVSVRGEEDAEAIITMEQPRRIEGRVELPGGKPAAGTYVAFLKDNTVYEETFADAAGRFHLRVASPEGVLHLRPPRGYVTEEIADIPVAMEEAKSITLRPIRLKEVPRLTGMVKDSKGNPVQHAIITTPKLPDPARFLSGPDGEFEFLPAYLPDERVVYFKVEHPQRFERADFIVEFTESQRVDVTLKPYDPVTARAPAAEGEEGPEVHKPMLGKEAPAWSVAHWFNAPERTLSSLRDRAVVLCFWGSFDDSPSGVDALEELSMLQQVYGKDEQVAIVALHDATSTQEEVQAFIDATGIEFPVALDTQRFETFTEYKVTFIPEFVLIDKRGKIRDRQPGENLVEQLKVLRRE
jgi:peroxiredoxin